MGTTGFGIVFGGRSFDTFSSIFLRLPCSPFRGCCGFGLRFLWPGLLPGRQYYRTLRNLRDRLIMAIRMWVGVWYHGGLGDTPPTDDVVPPFA